MYDPASMPCVASAFQLGEAQELNRKTSLTELHHSPSASVSEEQIDQSGE